MSNESSPVFSFAREEFQNLHVKMTKTCKVPVLNLGHCKSILSMGNLEGKLLWNIVGISLLAFLSTFMKLLSIDSG